MKLYKYTRIDQRLFENLTNTTLWFANARSFNDPYDCNSPVIYGATQAQIERYFAIVHHAKRPELLLGKDLAELVTEWRFDPAKIERELKAAAASANDEMGLLCLSANGVSIPMWSHYADGHKGLCLEFDTSGEYIFEGKDYWEVNYPPDNHYQKFFEEDKDARDTLLGLALTKSIEWRHEREYRVFQNYPGLYPFNPKTLTGVVFGYYASDANKATVRRLLSPDLFPYVRLGQASLGQETYALNVEY